MNNLIPFPRKRQSFLPKFIVEPADIIEILSTNTQSPSTMGYQLERISEGRDTCPGAHERNAQVEQDLLGRATRIRCLDWLESHVQIPFYPSKFVKEFANKSKSTEGGSVVGILRAYHAWDTNSVERGLAEVYVWAHKKLRHTPISSYELAFHFRVGEAKRARKYASDLQTEASQILRVWVDRWNLRQF